MVSMENTGHQVILMRFIRVCHRMMLLKITIM